MEGPFKIGYMFGGGGKEAWYKSWGYGWRIAITIGIVILLFAGITQIKNLFFPKPPQNINKPEFNVAAGGKVDYSNIQISTKDEPLIRIVPYLDASTGTSRYAGTSSEFRIGVRAEFDGLIAALFGRRTAKQEAQSSVKTTSEIKEKLDKFTNP